VSTKSKAKGTTAEREVVRYLQNWWPAAERRALSGNKDKGDVAGIPGVVVEIKAAQTQTLPKWQRETLAEQANAGAARCMLVVKRPYKAVPVWDAYLPIGQLPVELRYYPVAGKGHLEWVRLDLFMAVALLRCPWLPSSPTTA
jgi:Holliday junction resolvase